MKTPTYVSAAAPTIGTMISKVNQSAALAQLVISVQQQPLLLQLAAPLPLLLKLALVVNTVSLLHSLGQQHLL